MGRRLLPLAQEELFAHSLALERYAASRYRQYARIVRQLGHHRLAETFARREREGREQVARLERAAAGRALPRISAWEYPWIHSDAAGHRLVEPPRNAEEAIETALAAERRAEAFYCDVAAHGGDAVAKSLAGALAGDERRHIEELEGLLGRKLGPIELDHDQLRRRSHHRDAIGRNR